MQEKDLFEYAVIRVVPRVEREEFINTGIVVYCRKQKFLGMIYELNADKLNAFCKEIDISILKDNLCAFERICIGGDQSGTIGQLDMASRFRWLTAMRSTVIQTSRAHAGLSINARETMERLFAEMVL
ncbi:MAG: DUF3037 domain-containing protein [Pedobacter sp.]|uniref:DUF3037 domain-containing protein n=1 Tax=Pedobacter sp. TaxID=1411316 RepID=UPI0035639A29